MCNFISWIEYKGEILFLTKHELATNKGKELRKHLGSQFHEDIIGHGAIEYYYDLKPQSGVHKECEDFSSPDNFPLVIQQAIKVGDFAGLGAAEGLLTNAAYADYVNYIERPAYAGYLKIKGAACADYAMRRIRKAAYADYEKIKDAAYADYKKIERPAYADYKKIEQSAFWKLFKVKSNRQKAWR